MAEIHGFQTEVAKLLRLLAQSLYSNPEVFLRELVSNASDAVDKLRFAALTQPDLIKDDPILKIRVKADKTAGTLTISDNGVGMTLAEMNENLGTIAKSGTEAFMAKLSGDEKKDAQLIGQFGVGFYSAFIVADRVTVLSRRAGEASAAMWTSEGAGTYESGEAEKASRGTDVILHLKPDAAKFLERWTLEDVITKYSDHIATPVELWIEKIEDKKDDDVVEEKKAPEGEWRQVNDARALWTMNPREVKDEDYKQFYRHLTHAWNDPLAWAHNRVEGELEYTTLLYLPSEAPYDLYSRETQNGLKLFVERVFIMDDASQFLPHYLRFVKGLIDTDALPLNVSRELLQASPVTTKLKKAVTKRALDMIAKLAADEEKKDAWRTFTAQFGRVLKEGVVEDPANQAAILKLLRFSSTKADGVEPTVSLKEYVERSPEKQKNIYYLVAGSHDAAVSSPYLEVLKKKGIEVLLLSDRVDEWMMSALTEFEGRKFISATAADLDLGELADAEEKAAEEAAKTESSGLIERLRSALDGRIEGVRVSNRLVDSAACVVGESDQMMTPQLRRMLEAAGQPVPEEKFTLEVNPKHPLMARAETETDPKRFAAWAELILDQAMLADQGTVKDPAGFVRRMNELLLGK